MHSRPYVVTPITTHSLATRAQCGKFRNHVPSHVNCIVTCPEMLSIKTFTGKEWKICDILKKNFPFKDS